MAAYDLLSSEVARFLAAGRLLPLRECVEAYNEPVSASDDARFRELYSDVWSLVSEGDLGDRSERDIRRALADLNPQLRPKHTVKSGVAPGELTLELLLEAKRKLEGARGSLPDPVKTVYAGDNAIDRLRRALLLTESPSDTDTQGVCRRVGFLAGDGAPVYRTGSPDVLLLYHLSGLVTVVEIGDASNED